jgi:tRNA threonylcarbamoyladenosine biosynthesis protein TsaE
MAEALELFLASEAEQERFAGQLAQQCFPGMVIFLSGDLGAGKTTFVRGFLRQLGYRGNVKSPTYTLVEPYVIDSQRIFHFDLYRLADPDELEYAGGRDYFDGEAICLVEWPEKAEGFLPTADIRCHFTYQPGGRRARICAGSDQGRTVVTALSY